MDNLILKVCNISKKFKKRFVLNDISFDVSKGEIIGILGKNGAGKSTLIRIISNLITPTSGEFFFYNDNLEKSNKSREKIGVLLEGGKNIYHYLTIEDNIY